MAYKGKIIKSFCERDCADCESYKRDCNGCPVLKGNLCWMAANAPADARSLKDNKSIIGS